MRDYVLFILTILIGIVIFTNWAVDWIISWTVSLLVF